MSKGVALYGVETVELGCEPLVHQELKFGGGGFTRLEKSNKIGVILGDMSRKCAEKANHCSLYHSGQIRHEYNMHSFSLNLYI